MTELVEIRPLKPFVGSYRCSVAEADYIDDALDEKDGAVITVKVPRKRVIGLIPVTRAMTDEERKLHDAGQPLAEILEILEPGYVAEHPRIRTLMVPPEFASSAVARGIAEMVEKKPTSKKGA